MRFGVPFREMSGMLRQTAAEPGIEWLADLSSSLIYATYAG